MNLVIDGALAVAIIASIAAITRLHVLHAILSLIVSFAAIAVVFYALGAPFIAALEIITYAGAIMVLFLFAVMLLNLGTNAMEQEKQWQPLAIWAGPVMLVFFFAALLCIIVFQSRGMGSGGTVVAPALVGRGLLGPYILGVELVALLLLAALVGAFHLGRRDSPMISKKEGGPA